MAIFNCKMCGGALNVHDGDTVAVCEYCGTQQTLPRLDNDRRINLYDRANHFRRNNDYDKAMGLYEQILNEDRTDAEAYWSIVLCRYGIEYVEDPVTHRRIPTVNRAQYTSIFADEDYKAALNYADASQRAVYEAEARVIDGIQKNILEISQREEPFDVFICYKETDETGRRTPDSVLANELYHELTEEGIKVFFSRISLENKLGQEYEPHIFAALNSAKVMVALGTKPAYFNAVWVKNEWSRYLALIRGGAKKVLIPAYRDMDPYDLPEEFSHLQAQDMSKLGFMQDLLRGIEKILGPDEQEARQDREPAASGPVSIEPLMKRIFLFLEDGDWESADEYCERVLDQEPENARAYLGKLMAERRVRHQDELEFCAQPLEESGSYKKVLRYGDEALCAQMKRFNETIRERNHQKYLADTYANAASLRSGARTSEDFSTAASMFRSISGYRDAREQAELCAQEEEKARAAEEEARKVEEERQRQAAAALLKKKKRNRKIFLGIFVLVLVFLMAKPFLDERTEMEAKYQEAISLLEESDGYNSKGVYYLERLGDYKDSRQRLCNYAAELLKENDSSHGLKILENLGDYKGAKEVLYNFGVERLKADDECGVEVLQNLGEYGDAKEVLYNFGVERLRADDEYGVEVLQNLGEYGDAKEVLYNYVIKILENGDKRGIEILESLDGYEVPSELLCEYGVKLLKTDDECGIKVLQNLGEYEDAQKALCNYAVELLNADDKRGITILQNLGEYGDAQEALYNYGVKLFEAGDIYGAEIIESLEGYEVPEELLYNYGAELLKNGDKSGIEIIENLDGYENPWEDLYNEGVELIEKDDERGVTLLYAIIEHYSNAKTPLEAYMAKYWSEHASSLVTLAGCHACLVAVKTDGTVVASGTGLFTSWDVSDWHDIVSVSTSFYHTVGLTSYGTVVATGSNTYGQCNVSDWTGIVAVIAGDDYTLGIRLDGSVVYAGDASNSASSLVSYQNVADIKTNAFHSVALKTDGTVVAVGEKWCDQCDVDAWSDIVAVAAGQFHTLGLKSDGTVVAVGSNSDSQCDVSDWTDIVAIAAGDRWSAGLKADGSVVVADKKDMDSTGAYVDPYNVSDWHDIVALGVNSHKVCGLKSDGTIVIASTVKEKEHGWTDIRTP